MKSWIVGTGMALMLCASSAQAEIVTLSFRDTNGTDLLGSLSYDTAATPFFVNQTSDWTISGFRGISPVEVTFAGQHFTVPIENYQLTTYDGVGGAGDRLSIDHLGQYIVGDRKVIPSASLTLNDSSGLSIFGSTLPSSFSSTTGTYSAYIESFNLGNITPGRLVIASGQGDVAATFSTVAPTPEMPAAASFALGLALIGAAAWWQRRRHMVAAGDTGLGHVHRYPFARRLAGNPGEYGGTRY